MNGRSEYGADAGEGKWVVKPPHSPTSKKAAPLRGRPFHSLTAERFATFAKLEG